MFVNFVLYLALEYENNKLPNSVPFIEQSVKIETFDISVAGYRYNQTTSKIKCFYYGYNCEYQCLSEVYGTYLCIIGKKRNYKESVELISNNNSNSSQPPKTKKKLSDKIAALYDKQKILKKDRDLYKKLALHRLQELQKMKLKYNQIVFILNDCNIHLSTSLLRPEHAFSSVSEYERLYLNYYLVKFTNDIEFQSSINGKYFVMWMEFDKLLQNANKETFFKQCQRFPTNKICESLNLQNLISQLQNPCNKRDTAWDKLIEIKNALKEYKIWAKINITDEVRSNFL